MANKTINLVKKSNTPHPREHWGSPGYSNIFSSQCEIFDEIEDYIFVKQLYYIGCIDMIYPQCEFFGDIQAVISMQKLCYTGSIDRVSLQCELYDGFQGVLKKLT